MTTHPRGKATQKLEEYLFFFFFPAVGLAVVDWCIPAFLFTKSLVEGCIYQDAACFERGRGRSRKCCAGRSERHNFVLASVLFHAQIQSAIFIHFYLSSLTCNKKQKHV